MVKPWEEFVAETRQLDGEAQCEEAIADLTARRSGGGTVDAADYLAALPAMRNHPELVVDLVVEDWRTSGEVKPTVDDLVRRFPEYAPQLRKQFQFQSDMRRVGYDLDPGGEPPVPVDVNTPAPRGRTDSPVVPPVIPGYSISLELGRGGMGVVYLATVTATGRKVAVKLLAEGRVDPERFRNEGRIVAALDHPNVVRLHHYGDHDGRPYLEMEYLPGGTLAEQIAKRNTDLPGQAHPPTAAAALIESVARATHHAHQKGVIHRDIKPGNILFAADKTPKLGDFGLAKQTDAATELTRTDQVVGTWPYMAPEQLSDSRQVTPATDVYALGVVLYELLTTRRPFVASTLLGLFDQIRKSDPQPPRQVVADIPRDLETICLKCLHKNPARRYATAADLAADLRRFQNGEPVQARPVGRVERTWKWVGRHPARSATLAAGVLAAVVLSGVGVYAYSQFVAKKGEAALRQAAELARDFEARTRYLRQIGLAHTRLLENDLKSARALLESCSADYRNWEWDYLDRISNGSTRTLTGPTRPVTAVAFSRDGGRVAAAGFDGCRVWDRATGQLLVTLPPSGDEVTGIGFTPAGHVVTPGKRSVVVWDVSGKPVKTLTGPTAPIRCVAVSGDGKFIAAAGDGWVRKGAAPAKPGEAGLSNVCVWDTTTGGVAHEVRAGTGDVTALAFAPDGRLAVAGSEGVEVWTPGAVRPSVAFRGHLGRVFCVAFSPDGGTVASGAGDGKVVLWDSRTGVRRDVLHGHTALVSGVAFDPDGRHVVSASWDRTFKVWDTALGGDAIRTVLAEGAAADANGAPAHCCALDPTGRVLATGGEDRVVKLWDVDADPTGRTIRVELSFGYAVALGPGGLVAAAAAEGEVRVWNSKTGETRHTFGRLKGTIDGLAFSPDGRFLAAAGYDFDEPGWVKLWDLKTGGEHAGIPWAGEPATAVAFSPDGRFLACAGGGRFDPKTNQPAPGILRVWDIAGGRYRFEVAGPPGAMLGVAYSPDGGRLVTGGDDKTLCLWDAATGAQLRALDGHGDKIWGVDYSPCGRYLASAGDDGKVHLWDANDGRLLFELDGHQDRVRGVAFGCGGGRLVSVGEDRTLKMWDVATGQEALTIRSPGLSWVRAAFDPRDSRVAVCSTGGTLRVFDINP